MIVPSQIEQMLRRCTRPFPRQKVDLDELWGTATVTWLGADLLRRYTEVHCGAVEAPQVERVTRALLNVEREMHWIRMCGAGVEPIELANAVGNAVSQAQYAAILLGVAMERGSGCTLSPSRCAPDDQRRLVAANAIHESIADDPVTFP